MLQDEMRLVVTACRPVMLEYTRGLEIQKSQAAGAECSRAGVDSF